MRSPEELAADISGYKIVVMPTVKTFELRSIEDAKRHFETHPEAAGILEKLPVEKMRFPSEIRSGNPHPKTDNYNICRMENHIRETWTCGEIIMFRSFTETGTFKPYEAASMKRIFDGLNNEVHIFMGAAAVLGEMNAKMCCGIFTDDGAILGLTINELRQLFNGKQTVLTRLDAQAKALADIQKKVTKPNPKPEDYAVTPEQLSTMLENKNAKRTARTIRNWESWLKDNKRGTQPPEGYTLHTRLTLQSAQAWVDSYAAQEKAKLNTKIGFDSIASNRKKRNE